MSNSVWLHWLYPTRLLCPWNSPGKNTGVGCHALLQGIFPTQGSNPGFPYCRHILYHLSHQGNPEALGQGSASSSHGPILYSLQGKDVFYIWNGGRKYQKKNNISWCMKTMWSLIISVHKCYLNTAIPTYLPSVFDCFNNTPAKFSNCGREDITH